MELNYEAPDNILSVKWPDELSVESVYFFQTIVTLFDAIQEQKVTYLIVDSGNPAGGVLTEEVINYFINHIPHTPLLKIALLESPDYLWDNNLYQVIKLLITTHHLPIQIKLVKSRLAARDWFSPLSLEKPQEKKTF